MVWAYHHRTGAGCQLKGRYYDARIVTANKISHKAASRWLGKEDYPQPIKRTFLTRTRVAVLAALTFSVTTVYEVPDNHQWWGLSQLLNDFFNMLFGHSRGRGFCTSVADVEETAAKHQPFVVHPAEREDGFEALVEVFDG